MTVQVLESDMIAKTIHDSIVIISSEKIDGIVCLSTSCVDYENYRRLPKVVDFDGIICGLTGWNSDRQLAYYQSKTKIARAI